ncbi:hypothetical protein BGX31_003404, partial [Mortierella sp. GBA43]
MESYDPCTLTTQDNYPEREDDIIDNETLSYIPIQISQTPAEFLIDSGSSANHISANLVDKLHLKTTAHKKPITVSLANGKIATTTRFCIAKIQFTPTIEHIVKLNVFNMEYDGILGKAWLKNADPTPLVDFKNETLTLNNVVIPLKNQVSTRTQLSAMQWKKATKKKDQQMYLALIRKTDSPDKQDPDDKVHPEVQALLKEYKDVFPDDLPLELPPSRT